MVLAIRQAVTAPAKSSSPALVVAAWILVGHSVGLGRVRIRLEKAYLRLFALGSVGAAGAGKTSLALDQAFQNLHIDRGARLRVALSVGQHDEAIGQAHGG